MQKMHILSQVPERIISAPEPAAVTQRWQMSFNVAGWIRFDALDNTPVNLLLRYRDASGVREIRVDEGHINSKTLLLSGVATLKLTGRLERVEVILQCERDHYVVDELFVQPVKEKTNEKTKSAHKTRWGSGDR